MLWNWLREKVRLAFLAGVADALQELEGSGTADPAEAVASLRARLGQQSATLPEPDGAPARRGRK